MTLGLGLCNAACHCEHDHSHTIGHCKGVTTARQRKPYFTTTPIINVALLRMLGISIHYSCLAWFSALLGKNNNSSSPRLIVTFFFHSHPLSFQSSLPLARKSRNPIWWEDVSPCWLTNGRRILVVQAGRRCPPGLCLPNERGTLVVHARDEVEDCVVCIFHCHQPFIREDVSVGGIAAKAWWSCSLPPVFTLWIFKLTDSSDLSLRYKL